MLDMISKIFGHELDKVKFGHELDATFVRTLVYELDKGSRSRFSIDIEIQWAGCTPLIRAPSDCR